MSESPRESECGDRPLSSDPVAGLHHHFCRNRLTVLRHCKRHGGNRQIAHLPGKSMTELTQHLNGWFLKEGIRSTGKSASKAP